MFICQKTNKAFFISDIFKAPNQIEQMSSRNQVPYNL